MVNRLGQVYESAKCCSLDVLAHLRLIEECSHPFLGHGWMLTDWGADSLRRHWQTVDEVSTP